MINEIRSIVQQFATAASPAVSHGLGAAFEAWLMLRIARRLRAAPYSAELRDANDSLLPPGGTFVIRGTPGRIGAGAACHVSFLWKSERHEIHANAEFRGRSTETHEIDLCILPNRIAAALRAQHGGRPTGQPRVAIECKFKESTGSKDEARQIVARQFDMHFLNLHPYPWHGPKYRVWPESAANFGHGNSGFSYRQSFSTCFNALCRLGGVTAPSGIYLAFNQVIPFSNLRPGQPEIEQFLNELVTFLDDYSP
jgi:hypothetical protein